MALIRRIIVAALGLAFCLTLSVATSNAQPGRARWEGNRGLHRGWTQGRHRGWNNRGRRIGRYDYGSRLSWWERRRLARQRYRMYNARNRYYRDGYLSPWERRRLRSRAYRYRQNSYRYRTTW
ncbi:MAG TPA: hypothetical protein VFZ23_09560 [Pyrinomonadaceae bacterium]